MQLKVGLTGFSLSTFGTCLKFDVLGLVLGFMFLFMQKKFVYDIYKESLNCPKIALENCNCTHFSVTHIEAKLKGLLYLRGKCLLKSIQSYS